jgi:hypothetical protein
MYVEVNKAALVSVDGVEDLTSFTVRLHSGCPVELIAESLMSAGAGRLHCDWAAINIEWLRQRTASRSPQCQADFEEMLVYAESKGWMDPGGATVMAQIEQI